MSKMYYAENPDAAHDVHELRVELLGQKMTFLTDAGVFSKKMIDFGSQLLLRCLNVEKGEKILDVGCGYGPIGHLSQSSHLCNGSSLQYLPARTLENLSLAGSK